MNDKDTFELFHCVFDEVHASDELLRKVKNMKDTNKRARFNFRTVSAVAACLVAVILAAVIFGNVGGENSFVLKAGAAEIGSGALVKIGSISPTGGYFGGEVSGDNRKETVGSTLPFAVSCEGRKIKSVTYTIKNAVFVFPYDSLEEKFREMYSDMSEISDRISDKVKSKETIAGVPENAYPYASYTINYNDQLTLGKREDTRSLPVQICSAISSEGDISEKSRYALLNVLSRNPDEVDEENQFDEEHMAELMEAFQTVYDEMYSRITVTAKITFEDGKTTSETLRLGCEKVTEKDGIIIGAKVVNK